MIKYIGSKRRLVPLLVSVMQDVQAQGTVLDLFAGTSRVGHALKGAGYRVVANDHNAYAATLARCLVQADAPDVLPEARRLVAELSALPGRPGFITETYALQARFFHPRNAERIDAIRDGIAARDLPPELEAVMLTSLMMAADRVDSTVGVQMAYLKQWAPRALRELSLRVPDVLPRALSGKGCATQCDALEAAGTEADIAYLDPPYNQHKYLGNYHVWETLVRWDRPEVYGVACKRIDVRARQSPFNRRRQAVAAMRQVLDAIQAPNLVVSFSDEGFIDRGEMEDMLASRGHLTVLSRAHPRYVGAKIGIHNPAGDKVGTVGHLKNREDVFVVTPRPVRLRAVVDGTG